eukprot:1730375-Lingulodinium_polyedra.AAC.1
MAEDMAPDGNLDFKNAGQRLVLGSGTLPPDVIVALAVDRVQGDISPASYSKNVAPILACHN